MLDSEIEIESTESIEEFTEFTSKKGSYDNEHERQHQEKFSLSIIS